MADDPSGGRDHEEIETIPWAMLSEQLGGSGVRVRLPLVLMVVAGMVVAFLSVTMLRRPRATVVPPEPAASTVVGEPPATVALPPVEFAGSPTTVTRSGVPSGVVPLAPTLVTPTVGLYSEADLMAALPEQQIRLAAGYAEAFVAEYFTVDGARDGGDDLSGEPGSPAVTDEGYSWVEWLRTVAVEPAPSGYRTTVAMRTLIRRPGGTFERQPVRTVSVDVALPEPGVADGEVVVTGSPEIVAAPNVVWKEDPAPVADVPADVSALAVDVATGFGEDVEVVGGIPTDTGWEVTVLVGDGSGVTWPLVVPVGG